MDLDQKRDELLVLARQWITAEVEKIGEVDLSTSSLLYRIDKFLLDKHGPTAMINLFGITVGYHDDPDTKTKRQKWRRQAAMSICEIVQNEIEEMED